MKKKCKVTLLWCGLLLVYCFASFADSSAVSDLSQKLSSFKTYHAQFQQKTLSNDGKVVQSGSGKVWLKTPGKFRWETLAPTHQILMTDGKTLWIYDVDLEQATQQPLSKRLHVNPASLLTGSVKDLQQDFIIAEKSIGDAKQFFLKPKDTSLDFRSIQLIFSGNELTQMIVINNLDESTAFDFSHIVINQPLQDSFFVFNAPASVDVVKQ